jgi:hypothetical protein
MQIDDALTDGTWFLHVVAKDSVGNIDQEGAHFKINIDKTAPEATITSPVSFYNCSTDFLSLFWSANDSLSGYSHSQVWVDDYSNIVYNGSNLETTLMDLPEGLHTINITVYDTAGNSASNQIGVCIDLTNPSLTISAPSEGSLTGSALTIVWEAVDEESGYRQAEVYVDEVLQEIIFIPISEATLINLEEGSHSLNVTIFDWSGRTASKTISIHVLHILDFPWPVFLFGFLITCVTILLIHRFWRKSV